jgi:kinesin family member 2/24
LKEKVDLTKYIEEHRFIFDQVFDVEVSNQDFYVQTVQPLVSALFLGSKVTCFAYGQTGSGKTHTMMGPPNDTNHEIPGMYLLAANDIFTLMEDDSMSDFSVYISFYEIYCGKLYDLLNNRKQVHARENASQKIKIVGLTEAQITSVDETMEVIDFGLSSRMTGTTAANADSSRSHAVLQI